MSFVFRTIKAEWQARGAHPLILMQMIRAIVVRLRSRVVYRYLKLVFQDTQKAANDNHPTLFCPQEEYIPVPAQQRQQARSKFSSISLKLL